jgi:hypothetical protein
MTEDIFNEFWQFQPPLSILNVCLICLLYVRSDMAFLVYDLEVKYRFSYDKRSREGTSRSKELLRAFVRCEPL